MVVAYDDAPELTLYQLSKADGKLMRESSLPLAHTSES